MLEVLHLLYDDNNDFSTGPMLRTDLRTQGRSVKSLRCSALSQRHPRIIVQRLYNRLGEIAASRLKARWGVFPALHMTQTSCSIASIRVLDPTPVR